MKKIKDTDVFDATSLLAKQKILKEINQDNLIDLFSSSYQQQFKPLQPKKASLDQQLSITISEEEKRFIQRDLAEIRKDGNKLTVSAYIRHKALTIVDIAQWNQLAVDGLEKYTSKDYNEKELIREKRRLLAALDRLTDFDKDYEYENREDIQLYEKQLKDVEKRLSDIKKDVPVRKYRLSSRVTYNEANAIRWRAARLSMTVADYVRFSIFGYQPNTQADKFMSLNARKRLYVSILDVYRNGWGNPPQVNECPNCARYLHDIEILKQQLEKYKQLEKARR